MHFLQDPIKQNDKMILMIIDILWCVSINPKICQFPWIIETDAFEMYFNCVLCEMGYFISIFLLFDCCNITTTLHPTQQQISSYRLLSRLPTEKPREGELRAERSLFLLKIFGALVEAAYIRRFKLKWICFLLAQYINNFRNRLENKFWSSPSKN